MKHTSGEAAAGSLQQKCIHACIYACIYMHAYIRGGSGWFPAIEMRMFTFLQYNFAVVGVAVVFWHAPLIVKQVYLVIASCIMAW
jgi:hypothetical protein